MIGDPTGLCLPMFMEELFWGCAGIGLAIVMPALALSAIGQAAAPQLNRSFGRGAPVRTRTASAALAMQDRLPESVKRVATKVLRSPRK